MDRQLGGRADLVKSRGTNPPEVDWNASHGSDFAKASVSLVSGRGLSATSHVGGASSPWVKGVIRAQQLLPGWGIRKHTSLRKWAESSREEAKGQ